MKIPEKVEIYGKKYSIWRKRASNSMNSTTHLYFTLTFPIAIKIKTFVHMKCSCVCVCIWTEKGKVCCKIVSHCHQFMRCKQTIRSNNARKSSFTDNSTINWKTYLLYDYMQWNALTRVHTKNEKTAQR